MRATADHYSDLHHSEFEDYKALSPLAVASSAAGVLSLAAFVDWTLAAIPLVGIVLGALALWRIHQSGGELVGAKFAWCGLGLSTLFWAGGAGWLSYQYAHEVPEGYVRVTYAQLQPSGKEGEVYPAAAMNFNGKKVFIKGYTYPGQQDTGIKEFIMVPDRGTCCFGGNPKLTDMIQVTLKDPLRIDYTFRQRGLAGVFRIKPGQASENLGGVIYHLEADYVK